MIFSVGMKKIDLLILKTDIDAVLEYLGRSRSIQISDRIEEGRPEIRKRFEDLFGKLEAAARFLGMPELPDDPEPARIPRDGDIAEIEELLSRVGDKVQQGKGLEEYQLQLQGTLEEVGVFRRLGLPLRELEAVTYLTYRIGKLKPELLPELRKALGVRALIIELDDKGLIFAASSKKGRFALDTELKAVGFKESSFPKEVVDLPPEVVAGIEKELEKTRAEIRGWEEKKALLRRLYEKKIGEYAAVLQAGMLVEELKNSLQSTESAFKLSGWLPVDRQEETLRDLESLTGGRIAIRVYDAGEVEASVGGRKKIPVKLRHGSFVRAFSDIVFSYGAPLYGTLDPTPLVSVFFVLLFAVMFGDVGQGFVGVLAGLALKRGNLAPLRKWKKYAPIFITVGAACMCTGFLYGSFFADENALVPLTRFLTKTLLGRPMDRFIHLLPSGGISKLVAFFGFTLGVGFLINSIGIFINIYNRFKVRDWRGAVFAKTGIVGAFLFWYAAWVAVRAALGHMPGTVDYVFLIAPLVLLFWGEPLSNLVSRRRPLLAEGVFPFLMEGLVEVMESVSSLVSNSVSFLRVGAFALSHAVLSLIVFQMAELISSLPGGGLLRLLVIIVGNALIIVLEGLIVSIQVIRLQYYEFFSKFFTETGTEFKPFEFSAPRH